MDKCMKVDSQFTWKNDNSTRNSPLLPNSIRGLIIGKSSSGKTTLLFNLLLQPGWLDYNHLYVFGRSLHQREYEILKKGFDAGLSKDQISNIFSNQSLLNDPIQIIEEYDGERKGNIKVEYFDNCKLIPDPSSLNKEEKNLLILDDCLLEKQNKAEAFYTRSRHVNCDCLFLSQSYFRLPRTTIRENSNVINLFPQDSKNLQHIHADHCTDISLEQFKTFCTTVWASKYNFVTLMLDLPTNKGKYRKNLDEIMSFIDLPNADKIVADYEATIKKIQQRNQDEKSSNLDKQIGFQQMFEPMIKETRNQTEDLIASFTQPKSEKLEEPDPVSVFDYYTIKDKDPYYSIFEYRGKSYLGSEEVTLKNNAISLRDGSHYKATPGLLELIYEKSPNISVIPQEDLQNYAEIAAKLHLIDNPSNTTDSSNVRGTNKWKILDELEKSYSGSGIVFLPSDIDDLETKLNILLGEFNAGNRAETRNQIVAIVDYLLEKNVISKTEAQNINDYLKNVDYQS